MNLSFREKQVGEQKSENTTWRDDGSCSSIRIHLAFPRYHESANTGRRENVDDRSRQLRRPLLLD